MAKSDGSVIIDTRMDTGGFGKGVKSMKNQVNGLTSAVNKLGVAIGAAFAVKKLIQFGKEAVELGSDLQEVQNVVDVTFTTMSDKVNEFAQGAAEAAGLSETMAKKYVGTFGAMAKAFGFAEGEAFNMSTSLTQLAGDVASFYNITQDEAYTKLKSVFTGETETLKDLGVVMTQNSLDSYAMAEGYGKTTKQMSEQEKVALRYSFVLDQLSAAQGDFARTSDSWANQTRLLKLNLESIMATFGQGLINFFTPLLKLINTVLSKVATLANSFKAFSEMIMGTSGGGGSSGTGQASAAVGELADGYNDATQGAEDLAGATEKANKANKKYLSGLDEIRTFQSETKDSGDISVGGIMGEPVDFGSINTEGEKTSTIFDGLIKKAKELADIFKSGFMDGLGDFQPRLDLIKESIASIKESLIDIFTDPAVGESANGYLESFVYMLGQITGSIASIGLTIGANLLGGFSKYLEQNKNRIKEFIVSMFDIGTEINEMVGDYASAIAYIFESFASEDAQQTTANIIGFFVNAFMGVIEIARKFARDIINIITKPFIENKEKFRTAFEGYFSVFSQITGTLKQAIDDTFAKINEVYDSKLKPLFDSVANGLSEIFSSVLDFWNNTLQPILSEWASKFDELWKEHIQPFINSFIEAVGSIAGLIQALWNNILKPLVVWFIDNILPVLVPIFNSLFTTVVNVIGGIIDIIKNFINIFSGVIDIVTGLINGDWQKVWDACGKIVENVFDFIFNIIKKIIDAIIGIIDTALQTILSVVKAIFTAIKDFIVTIFTAIKDRIVGFFQWATSNVKQKLNDIKNTWFNIWDSLGKKVSDIWDNITSSISSAVDRIKGWINDLLSLFDNAKDKGSGLDGFGGGGSSRSSVNVPNATSLSIPALATGTVIPPNAPFMAVLGDQKHGTNIEAPLDTIKQAVREVVGNGNDNGNVIHNVVQINRRTLFDEFIEEAKLRQSITGNNPLDFA